MLIAIDTETELIAPRRNITVGKNQINLSPFKVPDLVVVSYAADKVDGHQGVLAAKEGLEKVRRHLACQDDHLVFHNAPFDLQVFLKADPTLFSLIVSALEQGRIHDTVVLEQLCLLAEGYYDRPQRNLNWACPEMVRPHLADLAFKYAKMVLDKGADIRLTFGQYKGLPLAAMSDRHLKYAKQDAVATLAVFKAIVSRRGDPMWDNVDDLWGERIQVCADFCGSMYDQRGVRVDQAEAQRLKALFEKDMPQYQTRLVVAGLGEWLPKKGTRTREKRDGAYDGLTNTWSAVGPLVKRVKQYKKHYVVEVGQRDFHLSQNKVRAALEALEPTLPKPAKRTETGLLSIEAEDWKQYIPAADEGLSAWYEHERLKKIINTYLKLYSQIDEVYPRWKILVRSGRRATSNPNIQNIPKRKHGIRSLFLPRPGHVFVKCDYSFQELVTLAEIMHIMGIRGPLQEAIKLGDPHRFTAGMMLGKPLEEVSKAERNSAKAVNFGVPGGLGPVKLADYARKEYGQTWTVDDAVAKRSKFLEVYWDIREYLGRLSTSLNKGLIRVTGKGIGYWKARLNAVDRNDLKKKMMNNRSDYVREIFYKAERGLTVQLPTGRVRKGCRFTEGANTYFQGLASDVTKAAEFKCLQAGLYVTLVVHDEIVIECKPEDYDAQATVLQRCMLDAFKEVCVNLGAYARVECSGPLDRWGPATDKDGKTIE